MDGGSSSRLSVISIVGVELGVMALAVVLSVFSLSCALLACQSLSRKAYPLPQPVTPYTKVVFEQEHGDYELPLQGFTDKADRSFEVFYQWVLRIGYYPFTGRTLTDDLAEAVRARLGLGAVYVLFCCSVLYLYLSTPSSRP